MWGVSQRRPLKGFISDLEQNEERVRASAPGETACEGSEAGKDSGSGT